MGTLQFNLPPDLSGPALEELKHACIGGGQDNMPFLTEVEIQPGKLCISRREDESGYAAAPWVVDNFGTLMTTTATLIERASPYPLLLELARGKVNQLRNQAADWQSGGLQMPAAVSAAIHNATMSFGRAMARMASPDSNKLAQTALVQAFTAADELVAAYIQQVFQLRHQRQPRFDTTLGCRLGTVVPNVQVTSAMREAFNTVSLPMTWASMEPEEGAIRWEAPDQLLDWAITNGFHVVGGPLIEFTKDKLPPWLLSREKSLAGIASFATNFVNAVVKHFQGRIRTWQLSAGSNAANALGLTEEETLWLTLRIVETARQWDTSSEFLIAVSQPWGEYLSRQPRNHSPFMFADTLVRSGLNLAGLNLEVVMGVSPRGSYCRDLFEASRLIDLYSLLGLPLQITLGFPSHAAKDEHANADLSATAGRWRKDFSPAVQADWAETFGRLALCKPAVRSVLWTHLHDAEPHLFPACGLVDAAGEVKPAMQRLANLRTEHLR